RATASASSGDAGMVDVGGTGAGIVAGGVAGGPALGIAGAPDNGGAVFSITGGGAGTDFSAMSGSPRARRSPAMRASSPSSAPGRLNSVTIYQIPKILRFLLFWAGLALIAATSFSTSRATGLRGAANGSG